MSKVLSFEEVKRIVELIKIIDNTSYAMVNDVAKEGGWKRTDLAEYIINNKDYFKWGDIIKNNKKNLGRGIINVYLSPLDNPDTDAWLEKKKEDWKNKIYINKNLIFNDFYGIDTEYSFSIDYEFEKHSKREHIWRNTENKFNKVKKLFKKDDIKEKNGLIKLTFKQIEAIKDSGIEVVIYNTHSNKYE